MTMKHLLLCSISLIAGIAAALTNYPAPGAGITVIATPDGVLLSPRDFFTANNIPGSNTTAALEAAINTNAATILAVSSRVDAAEGAITATAADVLSVSSHVDNIEGSISANAATILAVSSRVDTAEGAITATAADVLSVSGRVDAAEGSIATLSNRVAVLPTPTNQIITVSGASYTITNEPASAGDILVFKPSNMTAYFTAPPDGVVFSTSTGSAYRGDWGAAVSNTLHTGPLLQGNSNAVVIGKGASVNGTKGISIGADSSCSDEGVSIGEQAYTYGPSVSLGRFASSQNYGVSIGVRSYAGWGSVVIGDQATSSWNSVVIGRSGNAGMRAVAVGDAAYAQEEGVALGHYAFAAPNSVAVGTGASNTIPNTTLINGLLRAPNGVSVEGGSVTISNGGLSVQGAPVRIAGNGATNGAVFIATNTAGDGTWAPPSYVYAAMTNNTTVPANQGDVYLTFNAVYHDLLGEFTGSSFVASRAGVYLIMFDCRFIDVGTNRSCGCYITMSPETFTKIHGADSSGNITLHNSAIVRLDAGQSVSFRVYYFGAAGTSCTLNGGTGFASTTRVQITRLLSL